MFELRTYVHGNTVMVQDDYLERFEGQAVNVKIEPIEEKKYKVDKLLGVLKDIKISDEELHFERLQNNKKNSRWMQLCCERVRNVRTFVRTFF